MVKIVVEDLSYIDCGGGYCDGIYAYIDSKLSEPMQDLVLGHEVLCRFLFEHKHITHDDIDGLIVVLLDAQKQLERIRHADQT